MTQSGKRSRRMAATETHHRDVALFRFGIISDLVSIEPGTRGIGAMIRDKAEADYTIPGTDRRRVAEQTIRDWLTRYRKGGFDSLYPVTRRDGGGSRGISVEDAEALIDLKRKKAYLSVSQVIKEALESGKVDPGTRLSRSTVYRLLDAEGLMDRRVKPVVELRRFEAPEAGALWQADVMHGPRMPREGKRGTYKTYLISFIDDATRVVPYSEFCFGEGIEPFLAVFAGAIRRRGKPCRLMVDNGSAFRSRQLELVCARLGCKLIRCQPRKPESKGKQERYFRSLRSGFLTPLIHEGLPATIDELNGKLLQWVEGVYHQRSHRGLDGDPPLARWAKRADTVERVDDDRLDMIFVIEIRRRVTRDCTVSIEGRIYELEDASLSGQWVKLRRAPLAPVTRPLSVIHDGQEHGVARLLDKIANSGIERRSAAPGISFAPNKRTT